MTAKAFILATACVCVPAVVARAWQVGSVPGTLPDAPRVPQLPARDQRPRPRTGTAVIRGRVVDGSTGQPLVHARVRIGGTGANVSMLTDASGSFAFTSLPSGRYTLMAMKPSYLQGSLPAISSSLRGIPGLPLADGQTLENLTLPLYHGSVILGHLVDAYGDPVEGVNVQVVRAPGSRSSRSFSMSGSVNDAGEFRISRLDAGAYLLFAMPYGGRSESDPDATANVPTYYPGVLSPDQAQPIVVERGQTLSGLDFQILEQPVTTVTGIVMDGGQPAQGGGVNAQSRFSNGTGGSVIGRGGAQVHQDGTFELKLPPGEYLLSAFARPRDEAANSQPLVGRISTQHFGAVRVTVGGDPVTNVVIRAGGGGTISGKIVFDGDSPPVDPKQISVRAQAQHLAGPQASSFGSPDECRMTKQGTVNPDLTFAIEEVRGTCVLDVSLNASGRWRTRSAIYHAADLLDRPIEIDLNQHVRDVTITISDRRTELAADVTGDQGEASLDHVVLAFSADKARWLLPRYVAYTTRSSGSQSVARPGSPGAGAISPTATLSASVSTSVGFGVSPTTYGTINTLPAGDYYVVAIDDATNEDIRDPTYLEQLVPKATRVTLREGEPQKLTLRRVKSPSSAQ